MSTDQGIILQRLVTLGITLPQGPRPPSLFAPAVQTGNLLYTSGHISRKDGKIIAGKLGRDMDVSQGQEAARWAVIELLSGIKYAIGDLDRVKRVVKLLGMVNSADTFVDQPLVMNAASQLIVDVFGEAGRHARSAVGMAQLPAGCAVEIEAILEIA